MKKNKILTIGELFFKVLIVLTSLSLVILTFIFIHSEFSPKTYEKLTVNLKGEHILKYEPNILPSPSTYKEWKKKTINFNKITISSKIILLVNLIFTPLIFLFILKEIIKFIKSIKDYNSFHKNNANYFTKIGKLFGLLLILQLLFSITSISIDFPDNYYTESYMHINFTPLITYGAGILLCFIISQVFKEGERLKIENELTI